MLDLRFVRENPELVKENIRKKFQDSKLSLVDEVIELDEKSRNAKQEADSLRARKNTIAKQIGADSLGYLKIEDFSKMVGNLPLCKACFDNKYPV